MKLKVLMDTLSTFDRESEVVLTEVDYGTTYGGKKEYCAFSVKVLNVKPENSIAMVECFRNSSPSFSQEVDIDPEGSHKPSYKLRPSQWLSEGAEKTFKEYPSELQPRPLNTPSKDRPPPIPPPGPFIKCNVQVDKLTGGSWLWDMWKAFWKRPVPPDHFVEDGHLVKGYQPKAPRKCVCDHD